jgi:hypothetical protein
LLISSFWAYGRKFPKSSYHILDWNLGSMLEI